MSALGKRVLLLGALVLTACGSDTDPGKEGPATVESKNGSFSAKLSPDPDPPILGENALGISLSDAQGEPVAGAEIGVEPWMPAHGHGSSTQPVVTELGAGEYRAEKIQLMMPGYWELKIAVEAGGTSDSFVVGYDVK